MDRVLATIVTYRRTSKLKGVLDSLGSQSRPVDEILVIDNDGSSEAEALCWAHPLHQRITYLASKTNTGPAGGTARAMIYFADHYSDGDWFTRLDDDKPAPDDTVIADLLSFAEARRDESDGFGGVAIAGGAWDARRARLEKVPVPPGQIGARVDYLATNFFPVFSGQAIRTVGPMDASLFFGMTEVDYGLRLTAAGFELWLHGDRVRQRRGPAGYAGPSIVSRGLGPPDWRRYYSLRNSIVVARRHAGLVPAIQVTVVRAIGKPAWNLLTTPTLALAHLRIGVHAAYDAWTGRMGKRIDPATWEERHSLLDLSGEMRAT